MKKYNFLKVIFITLGIMILLSWIIPASQYGPSGLEIGSRIGVGKWDFAQYLIRGFQYASMTIAYILLVGGFYGILNKTGVYKKIIDEIVDKFKTNKLAFLVIISLLLASITSFAGLSLALFFIFPFIVSILLVMEYDRLTILAATIGSVLIGIIGATYADSIVGEITSRLSIDFQSEIITRIFLLVISTFLLVIHIINNQSKNKISKNFVDPLYLEEKSSKKSYWPMVIVMDLVLLIMILSAVAWEPAFKITWFASVHQSIMEFEILSTPIFNRLLGNIPPFGLWTISEFSMLILIASIIIAVIYKIKLDNAIEAFGEGIKKVLPVALVVGLIHIAFAITSNHLYYFTIIDKLLDLTSTFNILTMSLVTIVGGPLTVDLMYFSLIIPIFTNIIQDNNVYPIISVLIQSIYGFTMLLVPTSLLLAIGLSYLDVSYISWLKYIYRFAIRILIVIIITLTIMTII